MRTVHPDVKEGVIPNPGRGWMLMMPGAGPEAFGDWRWVTAVYHRVDWSTLEPEEGRFAWDDPKWEGDFRRWTERGYPVGLDVMCCNPHGPAYCTPQWVAQAGCKGHFYRRDSGDPMHHGTVMDRWEPDYNDPVFKRKLEAFLTAMAARYDDDPMVEFVTLRSYAAWGEWWTPPDVSHATIETLRWTVELHRRLFRKTRLLIPVASPAIWEPVIKPALDAGMGLRKDGLGGPVHPGEPELFDRAYHRAPVMLEFWGPRDYLTGRGWDKRFDKEECILRWHASRVNMGFVAQAEQWVRHEPEFLDRIAESCGYRLTVKEAAFDEGVSPGGRMRVAVWCRNDGVAPYTGTGEFALCVRDGAGRETVLIRDATYLSEIKPVAHFGLEREIEVPAGLAEGEYEVSARATDRFKGLERPVRFGNADDAGGRVALGKVTVRRA